MHRPVPRWDSRPPARRSAVSDRPFWGRAYSVEPCLQSPATVWFGVQQEESRPWAAGADFDKNGTERQLGGQSVLQARAQHESDCSLPRQRARRELVEEELQHAGI